MANRGVADLITVAASADAARRIDHEVDLSGMDQVDDVGRTFGDLADLLDRDPHPRDRLGGSRGGDDAEAEVVEAGGKLGRGGLVAVGDGDEDGALERQRDAGGGLRLAECRREVAGDAHHLAGRLHLGPEDRIGAGEASERAEPPP